MKCPYCSNDLGDMLVEKEIMIQLEDSLKEQATINEFLKKDVNEQLRILLAKYWLTHSNDTVYDQFGCNFVPNMETQDKARDMINIGTLELSTEQLNQINKSIIKSCINGYLNFAI